MTAKIGLLVTLTFHGDEITLTLAPGLDPGVGESG